VIRLEKRIENFAKSLYAIEHRQFASRLGLRDDPVEVIDSPVELGELIFSIDELSWSEDADKKKLAIQLIALSWEYLSKERREDLREFLIVCLSRLGVAPSTVMIDNSFLQKRQYEAFHSFSAQLATVALQLPTQVRIGQISYQLTSFQARSLDGIERSRISGLSAPTSAGKSFVIYLAIIRHSLVSDSPCVYIVPTISLVNQVSSDIRGLLTEHGIDGWQVLNSYDPHLSKAIFVLTQERAIVALDQGMVASSVGILVVDEVQNLERVTHEDELRSKILFDFMRAMRFASSVEKIIVSGPRLDNIDKVAESIFDSSSIEEKATESPVASLTYSVESTTSGFFLNQHSDALGRIASLKINRSEVIGGVGQNLYTEEFYRFLSHVVYSLGDQSRNLIFSPTASQARKTAERLSGFGSDAYSGGLDSLSSYLSESVHPKYPLVAAVKRGVAFHSGSVPSHARLAIEQAFGDGLLKDVVCTTTLMQGVNLPADVVFIRNPNLYVRKSRSGSASLSPYEFANLRGRAGRLLKDFVGRTVVLDEGSFKSEAQGELFVDTYKDIVPGYSDIFAKGRDEILSEIAIPGSAESDGSKFLASHIRQTVYRHPDSALQRLVGVGVSVLKEHVEKVRADLRELDVGRHVILANRYWDPFDLQKIKDHLHGVNMELPNDVWSKTIVDRVVELLRFQSLISPYYYRRHLGSTSSDPYFLALALSAQSWGREVRLRTIIDERHFSGDFADKVEDQVELIYKKVVYGLTAILKPISDIQESGAALLAAFESGVYHPVSRYLVSAGLYRETAVLIRRKLLANVRSDELDIAAVASSRLLGGLDKLDPWTRRQVEPVIRYQIRRS
jgi:DEAD/DEAH box helicase